MDRLLKFYNQNRYIIWLVILILIAIFVLIQILDNIASKKISIENTNNQKTDTFNTIDKNYSIISGERVKTEVSDIIDDFINYCNNKEVEKAYELLSDECKEILYPTVEDFTNNYYSKLFYEKKTYLYQAWLINDNKYTYKVDFIADMLATGTASNTSITDYYTAVKKDEEYKLSINKFIEITDINKKAIKDNITININRKRIYMDYETYEIEVINNSNEKMMLDALQNADTIYVEDDKGQKYYWQNHEILEEDISIEQVQGKKIEIKFNKEYRPKNQVTKIIFSNIALGEKILNIEILL